MKKEITRQNAEEIKGKEEEEHFLKIIIVIITHFVLKCIDAEKPTNK